MQFVSLPRIPLPIRPNGDQQHTIVAGSQNVTAENFFAQFPYAYPGFYAAALQPMSRMAVAGLYPGLNLQPGIELPLAKLEESAVPPPPTFMNTRLFQQATDTSNMMQTCRMSDIFDAMSNTESSQSLLHGTPPLSVPSSHFLGYHQSIATQNKVPEVDHAVMVAKAEDTVCEDFLRGNVFLEEASTVRPADIHDASMHGAEGNQQMSPVDMKQGRACTVANKMTVPRRTSNKPKAPPAPAEAKSHASPPPACPPTPVKSSAPQPTQTTASAKDFSSSPATKAKTHGAPVAATKSEAATVTFGRKMSQTHAAAGAGETGDERPKRQRKESECTTDGDGADSDVRKFAKLEKNRQSARECRRRKKAYIKDLEQKIDKYEVDNTELGDRLAKAEREKSVLQAEIQRLREVLGA